jgi:hypothetical protein
MERKTRTYLTNERCKKAEAELAAKPYIEMYATILSLSS